MNRPLFSEVLKVMDGCFCDIIPHVERMNRTAGHFYGTAPGNILANLNVPDDMRDGVVKCRVLYDDAVRSVEFAHYVPRIIGSVAIVEAPDLDYRYKYADRQSLDMLRKACGCDEVVFSQNGLLTDASFANILLEDVGGKLYTPSTPLLQGTMRWRLLQAGVVSERQISAGDLSRYCKMWFVNAMLGIDDKVCVPIASVRV